MANKETPAGGVVEELEVKTGAPKGSADPELQRWQLLSEQSSVGSSTAYRAQEYEGQECRAGGSDGRSL